MSAPGGGQYRAWERRDDETYLLTARTHDLCPGHLAEAIRTARLAGRVATDEMAAELLAVVRSGPLPPPAEDGYYDCIVERLAANGDVDQEVDARWAAEFQTGAAQRDPRVQAFAAACAERLAELVAASRWAMAVLARYLEAPLPAILVRGVAEDGRPVLGFETRRFLVIEGGKYPAPSLGSALAFAERYAAAQLGVASYKFDVQPFDGSFVVEW